jgi:hypothetical protein
MQLLTSKLRIPRQGQKVLLHNHSDQSVPRIDSTGNHRRCISGSSSEMAVNFHSLGVSLHIVAHFPDPMVIGQNARIFASHSPFLLTNFAIDHTDTSRSKQKAPNPRPALFRMLTNLILRFSYSFIGSPDLRFFGCFICAPAVCE